MSFEIDSEGAGSRVKGVKGEISLGKRELQVNEN